MEFRYLAVGHSLFAILSGALASSEGTLGGTTHFLMTRFACNQSDEMPVEFYGINDERIHADSVEYTPSYSGPGSSAA